MRAFALPWGALLLTLSGLSQDTTYQWRIPSPFPRPAVPASNPMNDAKVELGRRLFYDVRLSVNGRQSCATCHRQELAFTDGRTHSVGATGERHPRGSMSLANVAYNPALTWANPDLHALEAQARIPLLSTTPIEHGLAGHEKRVLVAVGRDPMYRALVPRAFAANGGAGNVQAGDTRDRSVLSIEQIVQAIAAFERTMVSVQSPYDRYRYGNQPDAISESAKRGETFFFSGQRGGCFQCHGGWNFNGALRIETDTQAIGSFFNTGLYNVAGAFSYPRTNTGIHAITQLSDDVGRFRVPTLRNIAVTAPYMHDGSIATLAEVLDHYAAGGRTIASGPNAGVGQRNPNKSARVHGFSMTGAEKRDLLAFLESLTDSLFLHNPALSNPWLASKAEAALRRLP